MRQKRTAQQSLFDPEPVHHPVADALEAISAWLDAHPELLDAIAADLGTAACGRAGLNCETVLRCAVLKHLRQEAWRGLEFTLYSSHTPSYSCPPSRHSPSGQPQFAVHLPP